MAKDTGRWVNPGLNYVTVTDGPRAGSWESIEWWERSRVLASRFGESVSSGRTLAYVETAEVVEHPRWPEAKATVWRWDQ